MTIQFVIGVLRGFYVNGHPPNFLMLPLYWLIWNLLPFAILCVGRLLRSQGR